MSAAAAQERYETALAVERQATDQYWMERADHQLEVLRAAAAVFVESPNAKTQERFAYALRSVLFSPRAAGDSVRSTLADIAAGLAVEGDPC